jgi:LuxR family transcriptional regulator, maltose regulon positive regulatory protein
MPVNQDGPAQESLLLLTKFYMPPGRATLVARPHLLHRLDSGVRLGHRLGLISAPAGYGKTTLAAAWINGRQVQAQMPAPLAWLSLDDADNDPLRLFTYLLTALRRANLDIGERGEALLRQPQPSPSALGLALIEDLSPPLAAATAPPILVLDDYHRIQNPLIHETVQFLVEHLPSQLYLLLLTREDPPLPLPRWRVQNRMTELRARDLRFSAEEAADFLNRVMALDLPADWVTLLEARTEGWIAGLQLAALSLQDRPHPHHFVQTFAGDDRQVVDYLVEEVLASQPQDVRRFLLYTSILDRMCPDLCDWVLGNRDGAGRPLRDRGTRASGHQGSLKSTDPANSHSPSPIPQSLLVELERRNLFLVPLDSRRYWYRYHHLFADLLRHHLQTSVDAATVATLHRRAARWYAAHGYPTEAISHALAADDLDLAADLIEAALAASATWSSGEVGRWQTWWQALPKETVRSRPALSLRISRALYLAGYIEQAEDLLDQAEAALRKSPPVEERESLLAQARVYRAAVAALRGEIRHAIEETHRALTRLPMHETLARARAYDTLGAAYELRGDVDEATWAYLEASSLAQSAGVLYLVINARCEAAMVQIVQGELQRALATCRSAIELAGPEEATFPPVGLAWSVMGEILREQNELAQAEQALRRGIALSQQGGITDDLRFEFFFLARLHQSRGDLAGALAALQQADLLLQGYHVPRLSALVAAHRVRIWLAQGQQEVAERWADAYTQRAPTEYLREYEDLTLARVWMATGRTAEAAELLNRLLSAAEENGRMGHVIEILALLALAHESQGDGDRALATLARVLPLAEAQGYARLFLDEGRPMVRLLYRASRQGIAPTYVNRLLAMIPAQEDTAEASGPSSSTPTAPGVQPLIEPLTERELEVLALLAQRLTNAEICQRLVISLPTVKSHTSNLYSKLGVSSRQEAVARARALGILLK